MLIRLFLFLIALLQSFIGSPATCSAATVVIDSFGFNETLNGRAVVSSVPDPNTWPGVRGELPGRAFAFTVPEPGLLVHRVEIGLSFISGSRDVVVSIHGSDVQNFPYVPHRVRTIPSEVLVQDRLVGVLPDERAFVTWDLGVPFIADPATEYFLSVTTVPGGEPSRFGWEHATALPRLKNGSPRRGRDSGFERAFQFPDRSWGSYQFNTFPRAAFRIEGWTVPEPSTALLMGLGLFGLSTRRVAGRTV